MDVKVQDQREGRWARLGRVFVPWMLTEKLDKVRKSGWWIPALLSVLVVVVLVFVQSRADCQHIYQIQLDYYAQHPEQPGCPTEAPSPPTMTLVLRAGGRVFGTIATWLVWAGGLYLAVIVLGQHGLSFGILLKLVLWSWAPYVVRGLIQIVYMWLSDDPIYNPGLSGLVIDHAPPPLGGGQRYVMPTHVQLALAALLSRLDVYLVWQLSLVLGGLGTASKLSRKQTALVTLVIWLVLVLLGIIPAVSPDTFSRLRLF
jgi:hypothetical protein